MEDNQSKKQWDYKPLSENLLIHSAAFAGLAVTGAAAVMLFPPLIYFSAITYTVLKLAGGVAYHSRPIRELLKKPEFKHGQTVKLPKEHEFSKIVEKLSHKLGRRKAPEIYAIDKNLGIKSRPFLDKSKLTPFLTQRMTRHFSVYSYGDFINCDLQVAKGERHSADELKFIAARELSHLKADKASLARSTIIFCRQISMGLVWSALSLTALSFAGLALPLTVTMGSVALAVGGLLGSRVVTDAMGAYALRRIEQRADRNAVYLTSNLPAAMDAINKFTPMKRGVWSSVPKPEKRKQALQDSFNKVADKQVTIEASLDAPAPITGGQSHDVLPKRNV